MVSQAVGLIASRRVEYFLYLVGASLLSLGSIQLLVAPASDGVGGIVRNSAELTRQLGYGLSDRDRDPVLASPAFAGGYDGFGVAAMPARRGAGPAAYPTRVREQQLVAEPNRRCDAGPVNRYVLIKTHKTGGSTLANILHRRTWRYKLRPVLPKNLVNMGWPSSVVPASVLGNGPGTFNATGDVLVGHIRYGRESASAVRLLVPGGVHLTILREPLSRFASAFKYYDIAAKLSKQIKKQKSSLPLLSVSDTAKAIATFAANPADYMRIGPMLRLASASGHQRATLTQTLLHNSMAFDLGLVGDGPSSVTGADHLGGIKDPARFAAALTTFGEQVPLVLINEYWDESMVLLRRAMCWDLDDVVYVSLKAAGAAGAEKAKGSRFESSGGRLNRLLPPNVTLALDRLLVLDWELYRHFNRTFWARIDAEPGFYDEVDELRRRLDQVGDTCSDAATASSQPGGLRPPEAVAGPTSSGADQVLCVQQSWENAKFGCEIAKRWGLLPASRKCKRCVYRCTN